MSRTAAALRPGPALPPERAAADGELYGGLVGGLIGEIEGRLAVPEPSAAAPEPPDAAHRASVAAGYLGLAAASAATVAGLVRLF